MHSDHELNRASWDQLAALHGQDGYYDSEALVDGASSLIEEEEEALVTAVGPDITGMRVLHLQCHLGFDAITFARRGCQVTGVDFSPVALAKARRLADQCGVAVEWICADSTELPRSLNDRFELVWATMGILCWIADARAWMRAAAAALTRGGKMVMLDGHPGGRSQRWKAEGSVAPERRLIAAGWDYATPMRTDPQMQFLHSLPAIEAAALEAGLRVKQLREHTSASDHLCIPTFKRENDGRYRHRVDGRPRRILYSLIAEK